MFEKLYNLASQIINSNAPQIIAADGFPGMKDGEPMLHTVKIGKAKNYLEVNLTTSQARQAFSWLAEITISTDESYRHFLLTGEGSVIETYGKQVIDVDEQTQEWLIGQLQSHSD